MPKVPTINFPDLPEKPYKPSKAEVHNMRYWKAKKAKVKPVHRKKKLHPKDPTIFNENYDQMQHLRDIMGGRA